MSFEHMRHRNGGERPHVSNESKQVHVARRAESVVERHCNREGCADRICVQTAHARHGVGSSVRNKAHVVVRGVGGEAKNKTAVY